MLNKVVLAICSIGVLGIFSNCGEDNVPKFQGIQAHIGTKHLVISQGVGVNYTKVNDDYQIQAYKLDDEGFTLYLGKNIPIGELNLENDSINLFYAKDRKTNDFYKVKKGTLEIIDFKKDPFAFEANYSGWAFSTIDDNDSLFLSEGVVNIRY